MSISEPSRTLSDRDQVRILFYNSHLTARTTQNYLIPHYEAAVKVGLYASSEQIPDNFRFSFAKITALARCEYYRHTGNVRPGFLAISDSKATVEYTGLVDMVAARPMWSVNRPTLSQPPSKRSGNSPPPLIGGRGLASGEKKAQHREDFGAPEQAANNQGS